jgi:hypothetical protein
MKEGNSIFAKGASSFYGNWHKKVVAGQIEVGIPLSTGGHVCNSSWAQGSQLDVRRSK